jgi:hypothetical protein
MIVLAFMMAACHDYELDPLPDGKPAAPDDTGVTVTGDPDVLCPDLAVPDAQPSELPLTCSPVDVPEWGFVVEAEIPVGTVGSDVVVMPLESGELPSVVLASGSSDPMWTAWQSPWETGVPIARLPSDGNASAWGRGAGVDGYAGAVRDGDGGGGGSVAEGGAWTHVDLAAGGGAFMATIADVDGDGELDLFFGNAALHGNGEVVFQWADQPESAWTLPFDWDGLGHREIVTGHGLYSWDGGRLFGWDERTGADEAAVVGVIPVGHAGATAFVATDETGGPVGLDREGILTWGDLGGPEVGYGTGIVPAVADTDGDDVPDVCAIVGSAVVVQSADDGRVLFTGDLGERLAWAAGGCALADLDADGNAEVVYFGRVGLRVYDVETAATLLSTNAFCTDRTKAGPVIADVDGDGSAEIVVTGSADCLGGDDTLYVLGAASGRWSRTRPVWNQLPYVASEVGSDGLVSSFPRADAATMFRAQPASDGDLPDLSPEAVDVCAESCDGGAIALSVRVNNLGSVDAAANALVTLSTWTSDGGLREVASAVIPEEIPAGWASAAVVLTVPPGEWGDRRVLEVRGDPVSECDPLNDRVEAGIPDPCG